MWRQARSLSARVRPLLWYQSMTEHSPHDICADASCFKEKRQLYIHVCRVREALPCSRQPACTFLIKWYLSFLSKCLTCHLPITTHIVFFPQQWQNSPQQETGQTSGNVTWHNNNKPRQTERKPVSQYKLLNTCRKNTDHDSKFNLLFLHIHKKIYTVRVLKRPECTTTVPLLIL